MFKVWSGTMTKCCLLFPNISFRSRDIQVFQICKSAKWWCHILNQILINVKMKKDNSANFYQKCLILSNKIPLNVLHNTSSNILLPWQHTGFHTSPTLKSSGWELEKRYLHGNKTFYGRRCVSCRIISLPSFNGLHCKLTKIALFIYLM